MGTYTLPLLCMVIFLGCLDAQPFDSLPRCAMRGWGDPHIETCDAPGTNELCYALGLRTYLDLFFLRVTVIHTKWSEGRSAIREILIDFKSIAHPHTIMYTYRASGGTLPTDFEYKDDSITANDTVFLDPIGPGVLLVWPFTRVIIIIDTWGGWFYDITIRGSHAVMSTGIGILIQGCPDKERGQRRAPRRMSRAGAKKACLANNVPAQSLDFQACMFDVIATGKTAIAGATAMSIASRKRVVSSDAKIRRGWPIKGVNIMRKG